MADANIVQENGIFGLKFAVLLAGFGGGVISLTFVKELSARQAVMSVFTGMVTANYLTPAVANYFEPLRAYENLVAFVIGLTAMNIIPGILKLSEAFKRDPRSFIGGTGK